MARPIDLTINLAQVTEVGRQQQIERDRPEGEKEYRALVIKTNSHLSEEQVEGLTQHATSKVKPRNEGGTGAGYYGSRRRKKKEEEKKERVDDLIYLPANFHPETGQRIDVVR